MRGYGVKTLSAPAEKPLIERVEVLQSDVSVAR